MVAGTPHIWLDATKTVMVAMMIHELGYRMAPAEFMSPGNGTLSLIS
jgi:hypothetical protein